LSLQVVKVTSALLLKVLGTVRTAFLILWGVYMYNEVVSMQSTAGYVITLGSFAWYTKAKLKGNSTVKKVPRSPVPEKANNSDLESELESLTGAAVSQ
jgi:hypothetical protein